MRRVLISAPSLTNKVYYRSTPQFLSGVPGVVYPVYYCIRSGWLIHAEDTSSFSLSLVTANCVSFAQTIIKSYPLYI